MNPNLQRALLLLQQERFELAEAELRRCLADEPNHAGAHAALALCLSRRERFDEATLAAQQAIHLAPDMPFVHHALAQVWYARNRLTEAETAIREAIALDPFDADYQALLAQVNFAQRRWQDALAAAEQGLEADPEHTHCINLRAMSLVKLGRKMQAGEAIQSALARRPEDAYSHANLGWALIEQGQHKQALEHFREALRIEPELDWARQGIVEALKAHNIVYRAMLRYFLWTSKLSRQAQWGIMIGGYVGYRLVLQVADSSPGLAPYVLPLIFLYVAFAIMTWVSDPLFNLALRLNRFGRLALSSEQITQANWVGVWVALVLMFVVLHFTGDWPGALLTALVFGLSLPALATTFRCDAGWPRRSMIGITAALLACGAIAVAPLWLLPWLDQATAGVAVTKGLSFLQLFCYGALASQFAGGYFASATVRK